MAERVTMRRLNLPLRADADWAIEAPADLTRRDLAIMRRCLDLLEATLDPEPGEETEGQRPARGAGE